MLIFLNFYQYIVRCLNTLYYQQMTECIKVIVRCRPLNSKQIQKGCRSIVHVEKQKLQIELRKISSCSTSIKKFTYDYVFDGNASQQQVYEQSSFFLVQNVLNGYNGTIFAYGQTGCGKTHTMFGVQTILSANKSYSSVNKKNPTLAVKNMSLQNESMGIIPRAFRQIITVINSQSSKSHLINCTFIEIYNQQIHDLLNKDLKTKISLQETPDGLIMKDLSLHLVKNVSQMQKLIEVGYKNRVIRQTAMNKQSSRSHCVFTIRIEQKECNEQGIEKFKIGKLNLVDLAGSQRQSKTNLGNQGIKEAAKINLSLSALGNVISALVDGKKQHIPYRDSKLTRILNDSLGGNTKTVMIATISPADTNYEQTLSTLRYSSRAKLIQNKPVINQDPKDALLRKYEEEIKNLKLILEGKLPYLKGNQTFYINSQQNQLNIFQKFPQLKNQENQAIMNQINQLEQTHFLIQNKKNQTISSKQNKPIQQVYQSETYSKLQKKQIRKQLNFLQQIIKKEAYIDPEFFKQLNKINDLKKRLKQQTLKQQIYKQQQKKRQQQLLNIQRNYKNLNDQVDSVKNKFNELKIKYVQTTEQLKDTREAHEKQKEEILQALRVQEAQNNKLMQVLSIIVRPQQLETLFNKCQWIENKKQWIVPKFKFSQRQGIVISKEPGHKQLIMTEKRVIKQLSKLQKASKIMKQTNLMIRNETNINLNKKILKNQNKLFDSSNIKTNQNNKVKRSQTHRQSLKGINLFESESIKKGFKNSYYSESNQKRKTQMIKLDILNKDRQQKVQEKNMFSLNTITKFKGKNQHHVELDLQQIKRQIMNEIRQKNKIEIQSRQK